MKAADWIDRLKAQKGWATDYRAGKELGLSKNTISNYRMRSAATMDEEMSIKVATALGEKPEIVLLDQAMERSKNEEVRTALGRVLKRIGGVAATVALVVGATANPAPAQAKTAQADGGMCIMLRKRRVLDAMMRAFVSPASAQPA